MNTRQFDNFTDEHLKLYRDNKANWGNTDSSLHKDVYTANNQQLRNLYGIKEDNVSLGELDAYIANRQKQNAAENQKNVLLTNLTNGAMNGDANVRKSAEAIKNFKYDPNNDAVYKSYVDMYNRQGQSAAKQTMNNLAATNMGRNSSYGAAATAQVQQAYAQKASEMIPTLAEQAYNKLLQNYNIEKDMSDTQYNRQLTAYQTLADAKTRELTDKSYELSNEKQEIYNNRYPELVDQEVALGEQELYQAKVKSDMLAQELEVYPIKLKQEIEKGDWENKILALQHEGYTYENVISKVTAEIQQKYGMKNADAQHVAQVLANQYTQKQIANYGSSGGGGSSESGSGLSIKRVDDFVKGFNSTAKGYKYYNNLGLDKDIITGSGGTYRISDNIGGTGAWLIPMYEAMLKTPNLSTEDMEYITYMFGFDQPYDFNEGTMTPMEYYAGEYWKK